MHCLAHLTFNAEYLAGKEKYGKGTAYIKNAAEICPGIERGRRLRVYRRALNIATCQAGLAALQFSPPSVLLTRRRNLSRIERGRVSGSIARR
jgi:hypothetical protein